MTTAEDVERAVRVSGPTIVTLRWKCTTAQGNIRRGREWLSVVCGRSVTLPHTRDAYEAGMCTARCPSCGHQLTQHNDRPEVAP